MESYRTLYRIKIAHEYFGCHPCTALRCRLTPQGADLARRRDLLFRQTDEDEWALLFRTAPAKDDILLLDFSVIDAAFTLYTAWDGFQPWASYELELPRKGACIEAASAIRPTNRKRNIGNGFCTLALRLTEEVVKTATDGKPQQATLCFRAPNARWEYLFIPHGRDGMKASSLRLEDAAGKMEFSAFRECEAYGREALRTTSRSRVPMRMTYDSRLRLTVQEEGRQKRILLPQVAPPEPGRYMDAPQGILRQICYY